MPRNSLMDLHNILFETLERLNDADEDDYEYEIEKAKTITCVAKVMVDNSRTMLQAQELRAEYGLAFEEGAPKLLIGNEGEK